MTHSPEDLTAGARAMYERQSKQVGGLPTWDKLTQKTRDGITADFEHGVAVLPDHTGELLEALEGLADAADIFGIKHLDTEDMTGEATALQEATERARITIAKARAP